MASKFTQQFYRHFRAASLLTLATLVLSFFSWTYLRYLPRETGHLATLGDIARAWSLPGVFAAAAACSIVITYLLARGVTLNNWIRFLPLIVLGIGLPIQLTISRILVGD